MKKLCFIILFFVISVVAQAQRAPFTQKQLKAFHEKSQGLLGDYLETVKQLAMSPPEYRKSIVDNIKNFFMPDSHIWVIGSKLKAAPYDLDDYLNNLLPSYKNKFASVVVGFKQVVVDLDNLKQEKSPNGTIMYVGDFSYVQETFFQYQSTDPEINTSEIPKLKAPDITDVTQKKGKFYIMQMTSVIDGNIWEIRLGDIYVASAHITKIHQPKSR